MNLLIKYCFIVFLLFSWKNSFSQTICPELVSSSSKLAFIRFQQGALTIDGQIYSEDDIWINAMYYNGEKGFTCGGRARYNGGLAQTMTLVGKDAFVEDGFSENTRIVLIAETDNGCILDSTTVFLAQNPVDEQADSLYFSANKIFEVQSLIAQTGDCLLTSANSIPYLDALSIYPNPTTDYLNIELELPKSAVIHYRLSNHLGLVLQDGVLRGQSIRERINLSDQPNGHYYLSLQQSASITTRKIVVLK